jgi:hypothetical protein
MTHHPSFQTSYSEREREREKRDGGEGGTDQMINGSAVSVVQ